MFVTFTDWEFDNIELAQRTAEGMWPKMQAAGAASFKATQTGDKTVRTTARLCNCTSRHRKDESCSIGTNEWQSFRYIRWRTDVGFKLSFN